MMAASDTITVNDGHSMALRRVRVFVSSTFRDMQNERDALNRIVFPYLRAECAKRYIDFTGIDLRWGITEDQSQKKETVQICIREIETYAPFFLGILGQRYGWSPTEEYTNEYADLFRDDISVTEAEMIHGALRFSGNGIKAVFCLRDEALSRELGFKSESNDSLKRVESLKTRIRSRKEDYPCTRSIQDHWGNRGLRCPGPYR